MCSMKMSIARRIGAAVTLVFATALCAADTEAPAGPVVLTVAGNIANTNRPAYNEKRDVFLKHHERTSVGGRDEGAREREQAQGDEL